ncbi:MAG: hypothetical protein OXN17_07925 [Candidatus Poribacteria bacterium]|nr:hypothetical protein [Candidatus Poribacteria bacterium]MDE0503564.1 hypothetical protein [Candidatus Poribacteria bacterium]
MPFLKNRWRTSLAVLLIASVAIFTLYRLIDRGEHRYPFYHKFFPGMTSREAIYHYDHVLKPQLDRRSEYAMKRLANSEANVAEARKELAEAQALADQTAPSR